MRTLVTGGAGFIGSHLVDQLLARGDSVVVLDDLSTGREENLADARARAGERLVLVQASVTDAAAVARAAAGCDAIYHLAGVVGVRLVLERPLHALTVHLHGTEAVLEAARTHGLPVFLASTSEVYGPEAHEPFAEAGGLRLPPSERLRGGYAGAKAVGEMMAAAYAAEHGLRYQVYRFFNTVGARQRGCHGMVLPRFCERALRGEPLQVYGDGAQTRCFADVGEVVAAVLELSRRRDCDGAAYNIGSEQEITIASLARVVLDAAGVPGRIEQVPFESVYPNGGGDPRRRVPDLDRLRSALGWVPTRSLPAIVADFCSGLSRTARSSSRTPASARRSAPANG